MKLIKFKPLKSWIFFRLLYAIAFNCVHNCEDQPSLDFISAVHMINFIYITYILHFHGNIWTYNWPAPNVSGFIAQLVRASHRYREVTGSNPVEVLNFFSGFFTQLHQIAFITARIIFHLISLPQFIYDLFHIHHYHSSLSREHMNPQLTCSQRQWLHSSVG